MTPNKGHGSRPHLCAGTTGSIAFVALNEDSNYGGAKDARARPGGSIIAKKFDPHNHRDVTWERGRERQGNTGREGNVCRACLNRQRKVHRGTHAKVASGEDTWMRRRREAKQKAESFGRTRAKDGLRSRILWLLVFPFSRTKTIARYVGSG